MESLVGSSKMSKMIRSKAFFFFDENIYHLEKENNPWYESSTDGIQVVLEKDAPQGREVLTHMVLFESKEQRRLNWDSNRSLECKQEKVCKMHPTSMNKVLLLNICTKPRISDGDHRPKAWYCIDLSKMRCEGDNWVVRKMGPNIRKMPPNFPNSRICVALGSVTYIIGSNWIYYNFGMSNSENEWLEGPSMNVSRERGSVVVHNKKIYVFGGFAVSIRKHCFGEVYDPVLNSWEPLSDPPQRLGTLLGKFVGSYEDKKLLVHSCKNGVLYAYDVVDKSWELLDDHFGFHDYQGVIMDNILYVFDDDKGKIGGYDLVQLKWLKPIDLGGLEWFSRTKNSERTQLYHAFFFKVEGNVLCLLYFDRMGKEGLDIYCKTFSMKRIMQEDGDEVLGVEVFSSTIYNLGESGCCINYVVT